MALGVDIDFAETVIQFWEHYDLDVKLECAIPCPNQTLKWSPTETARYKEILEKADKVTMVNDHYFRTCMLVRNDYMVDHSDTVLAVWNGEESGGTWHTIQYAKAKSKQVDIIKVDPKIKITRYLEFSQTARFLFQVSSRLHNHVFLQLIYYPKYFFYLEFGKLCVDSVTIVYSGL